MTYHTLCLGWVGLVNFRKRTDNRKKLQMMAYSHHCPFDILSKANISLEPLKFLKALSRALSPPRRIIKLLWSEAQLSSNTGLKFLDNHQKDKVQTDLFVLLSECYLAKIKLYQRSPNLPGSPGEFILSIGCSKKKNSSGISLIQD